MRIAIVSSTVPHDPVQTATYAKARALADRCHDVYLLQRGHKKGEIMLDGHMCFLGIGGAEDFQGMDDNAGSLERFSSLAAETLEDLERVVGLDVVEFPDHGYEGHAYLLQRDSRRRFPVVVQNRGSLPAFASSLGKSQLVFQPSLPPDIDSWEGSHSNLALLKAETFYHFAVNRAHSRVVDSVEATPA